MQPQKEKAQKVDLQSLYPEPKTYEQRKIDRNNRAQCQYERHVQYVHWKVAGALTFPFVVLTIFQLPVILLQGNPMAGVFTVFGMGIMWLLSEVYMIQQARNHLVDADIMVAPVFIAHFLCYALLDIPLYATGFAFEGNTFRMIIPDVLHTVGHLLVGVVNAVVILIIVLILRKLSKQNNPSY